MRIALAFLLFAAHLIASSAWALEYKVVSGAGGVPLNTVEAGDKTKPAIVLLHGFGLTHLAFIKQLEDPELTRNFHLIAMDLRGHGNSGKPWDKAAYDGTQIWADDVNAVFEAYGVRKAVLVGWSFGGNILAQYIKHYGTKRLAGINIVGSVGGMVPQDISVAPKDYLLQVADNAKKTASPNTSENVAGALGSVATLTATPQDKRWQDIGLASEIMLSPYVRVALQGRAMDTSTVAAMIDVPTLITHGGKERSTTPAVVEKLRAAINGAKVSAYEGIGHSTFYEDAPRFNRELSDFATSAFSQ